MSDPMFSGGSGDPMFQSGTPAQATAAGTTLLDFSGQTDLSGLNFTPANVPNLNFNGTTDLSGIDFTGQAPKKSPSILGKIGGVLKGIGSMGGEIAKETTLIPYQLGESVADKALGTSWAPSTQFDKAHPELAGKGLLPSQAEWTNELNQLPVAGGIVRGLQQTGEEIAHPSRIAHNYSANPVQAALNDIGSIATVLPGVGEAIHGLAIGGATTDAALAASKAGEGGLAAARAAKVGDIIKAIGEAPTLSTLVRGSKAGLVALADKLASDPELLHAVDESVSQTSTAVSKGLSSEAGPVAALNEDRAATAAERAGKGGFTKALGDLGTRMKPEVQMTANDVTNGMSKLRDIAADKTLSQEAAAKASLAVTNETARKLLNSDVVERINEIDRASLEAAAKASNKTLEDYTRKIGFTSLAEATNGRFSYPNAYVPNEVAAQLQRLTAKGGDLGLGGATLQAASKFTQLSRLALNPLAPAGRLGHAVLGVADNPNIKESFRLAAKDLLSKVKIGKGLAASDLQDLAQGTQMAKHGAVWEAAAKTASEDSSRLRGISNGLANLPTKILSKSPFLKAARAMDDSMRSGIWLAARHAGATEREADYLLGRTAGVFDRSSPVQRQISKAIPFYNWHKQSLIILAHMAENNPAAFAQFTAAAAHMTAYNEQQGISGSNTRLGNKDVNLSFLNPFSSAASDLSPQTLISSPLKAAWPVVTGVGVNQRPTSTPIGPLKGGGAQQLPAAVQELIKTTPQLQALINGSQPRYGTGQTIAGAHGGGALQTWSSLLGLPMQDSSVTQATNNSIAAAKAKADKRAAASQKNYQKKLAQNGQTQ